MKRKILSLLLTLTIVATFMPAMTFASFAEEKASVYVGFTSDVHQDDDTAGTKADDSVNSAILDNWINNVTKNGIKFDRFGICGDLGAGQASNAPQRYWTGVTKVFNVLAKYKDNIGEPFVICGNHEYSTGNFDTVNTQIATHKGDYKITGQNIIDRQDNYIIYSFGPRQADGMFHKYSNQDAYDIDDIGNLKNFLDNNKSFNGPIFIMSHFPLHTFNNKTGESSTSRKGEAPLGASLVLKTLNNAAKNNKQNIIFIWGHAHSQNHDFYDKFTTGELQGRDIYFTYAAAGTVRNEKVNDKEVQGKGFVAKIDGNDAVLTYYKADGSVLGDPVKVSPYGGGSKPTIDEVKAQATADVLAATGLTKAEDLTGAFKKVYDKANAEIAAASDEAAVNTIRAKYVAMAKNITIIRGVKPVQTKPSAKKNGKINIGFKTASYTDADSYNAKVYKYQIYRSTNSSFTKNVKKYKKYEWLESKSTYTNSKNLKKGKKYYFKVRGVVELDEGITVYTDWSDTKSVKCKKTRK